MNVSAQRRVKWWLQYIPVLSWLADYRAAWLGSDIVAGVTLAAYAIPVSLAYASLAGLPPQVGIYGYLLGGIGYALLGSSRQLAVGPTSAISLMIAGSVGLMAEGDAQRYAQIASLAAFTVALLCVMSWAFRLSVLVKLISNSILVGFKAGAALTIAMTQLPSFIGVPGGGHNFFERLVLIAGQFGQVNYNKYWRSGLLRSCSSSSETVCCPEGQRRSVLSHCQSLQRQSSACPPLAYR